MTAGALQLPPPAYPPPHALLATLHPALQGVEPQQGAAFAQAPGLQKRTLLGGQQRTTSNASCSSFVNLCYLQNTIKKTSKASCGVFSKFSEDSTAKFSEQAAAGL